MSVNAEAMSVIPINYEINKVIGDIDEGDCANSSPDDYDHQIIERIVNFYLFKT